MGLLHDTARECYMMYVGGMGLIQGVLHDVCRRYGVNKYHMMYVGGMGLIQGVSHDVCNRINAGSVT